MTCHEQPLVSCSPTCMGDIAVGIHSNGSYLDALQPTPKEQYSVSGVAFPHGPNPFDVLCMYFIQLSLCKQSEDQNHLDGPIP